MIGAMPAVAVRHERRKQEKRTKRPSQLYLGGLVLRHPSPSSRGNSPTPSPLQSPPDRRGERHDEEFYLFGKVSLLHMVVVSLLLGAILLIVGLVQLKPGADASHHRYYLMAAGAFLMLLGFLLTAVRCCLLPYRLRQRQQLQRMRKEESTVSGLISGGENALRLDNDRNAQLENGRASIDLKREKLPIQSTVFISLKETKSRNVESPKVTVTNNGHAMVASPTENDSLIQQSTENSSENFSSAT